MVISRLPIPPLRPFVASLWASEDHEPPLESARELVVPTGSAHLAVRLDAPLRLFEGPSDAGGRIVGHAVVGGARHEAHHRALCPSRSVGAQLGPGVAECLFGAKASELAGRHTALEDLWGRTALVLRERLLEAKTPHARLEVLEGALLRKLTHARPLQPLVGVALARLARDPSTSIVSLAKDAGYSQRYVLARFREAVGLSPKRYARLLRLQNALPLLASGTRAIDVALACGYADESHLHRDLREVTGLAVREYRLASPRTPNHVPR